MEIITFLPASVVGYKIFGVISSNKSRLWRKFPKIDFHFIEIFPSLKLRFNGKVLHFHHWFNLSILLILSILINMDFLDYTVIKGLMVGGVIQGLKTAKPRNIYYSKNREVKY